MAESVVSEELAANAPLVTCFLRNNPCLGWIMQDWRVGVTSFLLYRIVQSGELGQMCRHRSCSCTNAPVQGTWTTVKVLEEKENKTNKKKAPPRLKI